MKKRLKVCKNKNEFLTSLSQIGFSLDKRIVQYEIYMTIIRFEYWFRFVDINVLCKTNSEKRENHLSTEWKRLLWMLISFYGEMMHIKSGIGLLSSVYFLDLICSLLWFWMQYSENTAIDDEVSTQSKGQYQCHPLCTAFLVNSSSLSHSKWA